MARTAPKAKLIVVIDDDQTVLEGMRGLLRSWGYRVVTAASGDAALAGLAEAGQQPDFIICDYHLADGKLGTLVIAQLRDAFEIPALLITGAATPVQAHDGGSMRYDLLRKPVDVAKLQTALSRAFQR